jgi:hypothetical protein
MENKMKTSELQGAALDWAVALIEHPEWKEQGFGSSFITYSPSFDWSQGGPIIGRERICLIDQGGDYWQALWGWKEAFGPTPLVAAMRCYVASKLGDEVEVPDELA